MGAFAELSISLTFAAQTSDEVLMAFAPWRAGGNPPPLPSLDDREVGSIVIDSHGQAPFDFV